MVIKINNYFHYLARSWQHSVDFSAWLDHVFQLFKQEIVRPCAKDKSDIQIGQLLRVINLMFFGDSYRGWKPRQLLTQDIVCELHLLGYCNKNQICEALIEVVISFYHSTAQLIMLSWIPELLSLIHLIIHCLLSENLWFISTSHSFNLKPVMRLLILYYFHL